MEEIFRLTGGIYYGLMVESNKKVFDKKRGVPTRFKQPDLLYALFRCVDPTLPEINDSEVGSFKKTATNYKKGAIRNSFYFVDTESIPLKDVVQDYEDAFSRMLSVLKQFEYGPAEKIQFAYYLLTLLDLDETIEDDTVLYVSGKNGITKKQVLNSQTFDVNPFIFGMWLFVLYRPESNEIGKETHSLLWDNSVHDSFRYRTSPIWKKYYEKIAFVDTGFKLQAPYIKEMTLSEYYQYMDRHKVRGLFLIKSRSKEEGIKERRMLLRQGRDAFLKKK